MINSNLIKEYLWVIDVLKSCDNHIQISSSERLFNNLLNKWKFDITEDDVNMLKENFEDSVLKHEIDLINSNSTSK